MAWEVDPLGQLLVDAGTVSSNDLAEMLERQRTRLPLASLCYIYGVADEVSLVRGLSRQLGAPGLVFKHSCIDLGLLDGVPKELLEEHRVLPVFADDGRLFVACAHPRAAAAFGRQLRFMTGKRVVPHVALDVCLVQALRNALRAHGEGERVLRGEAVPDDVFPGPDSMFVVSDVEAIPPGRVEAQAVSRVTEDVTKEVSLEELEAIDEPGDTSGWGTETSTGGLDFFAVGSEETQLSGVEMEPNSMDDIDLDGTNPDSPPMMMRPPGGPPRVLIVDDDFATRNLLVKELAHEEYDLHTAGNGGEAVNIIKADPPDAVIIDVMLPLIDGFQICRAIKRSTKYSHIPVILMSAVIDSGRVTDDMLERYGADAYFEKPLHTLKLNQALRGLLAASERAETGIEDDSFNRALELYRDGQLDKAMAELRTGIRVDPLSAKHHFVLANLLQKQSQLFEAIDEYETTVELMPDYFPALTRLAYLYYKKGFSAKAIDTWRRALPHCPDAALRENIEVFMRKLIADMHSA